MASASIPWAEWWFGIVVRFRMATIWDSDIGSAEPLPAAVLAS
jgi:hypothetical protein